MTTSSNNHYRRRLEAVRAELSTWQVDALLIGSSSNRRWLSGFTGTAGWLLVTEDVARLGTDFRYWGQAESQAPAFELFEFKKRGPEIWPEFLQFARPLRVGVEARHMTLATFSELEGIPNVSYVQLEESVETLRQVKDDEEVALIQKAADITDSVMVEVNQLARLGMEEKQLAWELEKLMRERGASGLAFPTIVAFGPNSAMAHHQPGERPLQRDDTVIIDMGARVDGYASDLTRTFYVGDELGPRFAEIYGVVQQAQETALGGIRAGLSGKAADSLARDVISERGYGEAFGHSLGHGLGLDVHEAPSLSQLRGDKPLPNGSIVTVEPGIYLPEWGGVRIEDLIQVTTEGTIRLSDCPQNPLIKI